MENTPHNDVVSNLHTKYKYRNLSDGYYLLPELFHINTYFFNQLNP